MEKLAHGTRVSIKASTFELLLSKLKDTTLDRAKKVETNYILMTKVPNKETGTFDYFAKLLSLKAELDEGEEVQRVLEFEVGFGVHEQKAIGLIVEAI